MPKLQVRTASRSRDAKSRMLSQVNVANGKGTISKQAYKDISRKPNRRHSDVSLTQKGEKPGLEALNTLHLRPTARMPKPEVVISFRLSVIFILNIYMEEEALLCQCFGTYCSIAQILFYFQFFFYY